MIFSLLGIVSRQRQNESKSFLEKYPLGVNSELELLLKKKKHTHTHKTHEELVTMGETKYQNQTHKDFRYYLNWIQNIKINVLWEFPSWHSSNEPD